MRTLGKDEMMVIAVLALIIGCVCTAWWHSAPFDTVATFMILGGLLLAGIAVGMYRIFGPYSAMPFLISIACLGLYLVITAAFLAGFWSVGLRDLGADWFDHVSWLFREVGVAVSVVIFFSLWYLASVRLRVYWKTPSERPPSDLPAAAVSELVDREDKLRTPLAVVLEMLQKGAIEVALEKAGPTYLATYRLTAGPGHKYRWEQTVIEALPQEPTTRLALLKRIDEPELGVRQQIHEHLRHRGLLKHEGSLGSQNMWIATLATLGAVLMCVGLSFWMIRLHESLTPGLVMMGFAYATGIWIIYWQIVKLNEFTSAGRSEVARWRGFGTHLESSAFDEEREADFEATDPLLPYSAALRRIHLWRQAPQESPSGLAASLDEGWRENRAASLIGFTAGFLAGSYIYPGEGPVERIVDLTGIPIFGGGDGGGEFGDGDGGDSDLGF